jgi:hypothetical protein
MMIYQQAKGCREWQGAKHRFGYGVRWVPAEKRTRLVHRWVWEQFNGPIAAGMCVLHTCDNPACYLLEHLWLGTRADNTADMIAKGRGRWERKLTDVQASEIRAALADGQVQHLVAMRYGVAQATISRINSDSQ